MRGVNASSSCHSSSHHLRTGSCHSRSSLPPGSLHTGSCHLSSSLPPGSLLLTQAAKVILCISPAEGLARFGYIYLATHKCPQEEAIPTYFDSAGHEVFVIPCPDFEAFMADNHLSNQDIVFVTDLSRHTILASRRILQTTRHNDTPNLDWMPPPPNLLSFISSQTISSQHSLRLSQPLLSSKATLTHVSSAHHWLDLEGVGFNPDLHHRVPSTVFMGGSTASLGGISLMTIHELRNMWGASLTPSPAHSVIFELVPLPFGDSIVSSLSTAYYNFYQGQAFGYGVEGYHGQGIVDRG
jgi:hypothetical protein